MMHGANMKIQAVDSQETSVNGYQTHGVTQITAVFLPQILHYYLNHVCKLF